MNLRECGVGVDPLVMRFHVCGFSARSDGSLAGFRWMNLDTGRRKVKRTPGSTKIEAEWRAVLSVVEHTPKRCGVTIGCTLSYLAAQFDEEASVPRAVLRVYARTRALIRRRELDVNVAWLPRAPEPRGQAAEGTAINGDPT